jgi:hypothetical protein
MVTIGKKLIRTNDAFGHKPDFAVICPNCGNEMIYRLGVILLVPCSPMFGKNKGVHVVRYKCTHDCNLVESYHKIDDLKYLEKVRDNHRNGCEIYVPGKEIWTKEEIEHGKKLASLGYFLGV